MISAMPAASAAKKQSRARVRRSSLNRASIRDSPMFQRPGSRRTIVTAPVATSTAAAAEERRAVTAATRYTTNSTTSYAEVTGIIGRRRSR